MFSEEHSFSKTQLVKPTCSPISKKTPSSDKKRCHFWFWAISAETTIFIVFPGLHCFGPKNTFWPKVDSVHENARFSPFLTQIVSGNVLLKINVFHFSHFWMTTFKKHYLYRVFWPFAIFLFLLQQHEKDKNKKCNFLFENLVFDIPTSLRRHYFGTN